MSSQETRDQRVAVRSSLFRAEALEQREASSRRGAPRAERVAPRRAFALLVLALAVATVLAHRIHVDQRASGFALVDGSGRGAVVVFPSAAQPRLQPGLRVQLAIPSKPTRTDGTLTATASPATRSEVIALLGRGSESRLGATQAFSLGHVTIRDSALPAGSQGRATVKVDRVSLLDLLLPSFLYGR